MNRPELSAQLADEFSVDKASADRMVTAIFAALGDSLAKGEPVSIVGFGTFTTKSRPARHGRNPRTGETIAIAASTAPSFMVGKALRDAVNSGHGWWRRRHSLHRHHSRTDRQNPRRRRGAGLLRQGSARTCLHQATALPVRLTPVPTLRRATASSAASRSL